MKYLAILFSALSLAFAEYSKEVKRLKKDLSAWSATLPIESLECGIKK